MEAINVLELLKKALIEVEIEVHIVGDVFQLYDKFTSSKGQFSPIKVKIIDVAQDTNIHNGEDYYAIFTYNNGNYCVDIPHLPEYICKPIPYKRYIKVLGVRH